MAAWIKQPWIETALKGSANSLPKIARAQVLKVRCRKVCDQQLRKPCNQRIFKAAKIAKIGAKYKIASKVLICLAGILALSENTRQYKTDICK